MGIGSPPGAGRRPAHSRRGLTTTSEQHLRTLGQHIPLAPPSVDAEWKRRLRRFLVIVGVVALLVLVAVQWFRPLPSPVFHPAISTSIRLPGTPPSLPWPTSGSAALSVMGVGGIGTAGGTEPAPIASIAKVLTGYVVLEDHPLASGATGPAIAVDANTLAAYQSGLATQQSEVTVAAGETLTESQALEGLLVASGNDMATLLGDWDAGSTAAFVAKMNTTAHSLGLDSIHVTDPSGLDPATVGTATDLVRLGEAAMAIPAFAQIVDMGQVSLPMNPVIYNFDFLLGHDGFIGIKTGSDAAAGGCFLFAAQRTIAGKQVTLVGAVLGQQGPTSDVEAALEEADLLVNAGFKSIGPQPLVPPGLVVGRIDDQWGSSVTLTPPTSPTVVAWPGFSVPVALYVGALTAGVEKGTPVGVLTVVGEGKKVEVVLRAGQSLAGPSVIWRLTRL